MTKNISLTDTSYRLDRNYLSEPAIPTAAYIHIPFCRRRCFYCDFPISVVGDRGGAGTAMVDDYIQAVVKDIRLTPVNKQPLKTVFFGGGTPSLLSPGQLGKIIDAIASQFGIADQAEISMEIDPGTFDRDRLRGYLDIGLNRFSM
ncbi:MAG: radical SAM protein [Cyanobacteria bacterium J06600_6]